jgi:hypothetical protein
VKPPTTPNVSRKDIVMTAIHALYASIAAILHDRIRALTKQPESGAGGVSLEHVLLAIGGVVAAGLVVAAIAAVINSKTGDLNP